jgi:hypothetical protein
MILFRENSGNSLGSPPEHFRNSGTVPKHPPRTLPDLFRNLHFIIVINQCETCTNVARNRVIKKNVINQKSPKDTTIPGKFRELCRNYTGTIPELRNCSGTTPELFRNYTGTLPECRNSIGTIPDLRNSSGTPTELPDLELRNSSGMQLEL